MCRSPYPNDSDVYNAIRDRVRKEVFKGQEAKGAHRSGSEAAALTIITSAVAAYALYATHCNALTGGLLGKYITLCSFDDETEVSVQNKVRDDDIQKKASDDSCPTRMEGLAARLT
jgi:hypothetical protein